MFDLSYSKMQCNGWYVMLCGVSWRQLVITDRENNGVYYEFSGVALESVAPIHPKVWGTELECRRIPMTRLNLIVSASDLCEKAIITLYHN